jgi:hypothetical protein
MSKADIPARPMTTGKANIVPMVAVASTIAKGDPPEWLVLALANFQDFVGGEVTSEEARGFAQITAQMHDAADKLITWLPAFLARRALRQLDATQLVERLASVRQCLLVHIQSWSFRT